jgi:Methyltransferase domain
VQLTERTIDVVTGETNLEDLHSLADFPVFMGSVEHERSEDLVADMSWSISRNSGLIQLKKLLPLDVLYQDQTTTSAVGAIWMEHHKAFAEFLVQYRPSAVLELGGAHGILSKEYQLLRKIPWTILEPNPSPVDGCQARFIKGFFDDKFTYHDVFDTIVHSHVFEHMYEPDRFMRHLSGFMVSGQHLIFSLPNMQVWLDRKYTNCINFEHTVFLTEPYIEYLLAMHGYRLLNKEYFRDGHSIFYATVRDSSVMPLALPINLYEKNKQLYLDYVQYHEELIKDLNDKMRESSRPVYLFGAHVFAQYLIAFGLDTSRIVSLLDNDPKKQGKRLYGTSLAVLSPKVLVEVENPVVILKAGVYNQEIKEDILGNINQKVTFLE